MRLQPIVTASLLAGMTLLFYGFRITAAPPAPDETIFNRQAQSVAAGSTPLFFHVEGDQWLQPLPVYANAAIRAVGGDEFSGRLAGAIAGAIDVALVFLIAHVITERSWVGVIAAVLLIFTPAHRSLATLGTGAIAPVPMILFWLWSVLTFLTRDSVRTLAAGAAVLGLSAYSHPAAPLTAAFLWLLAVVVARRRNRIRLAIATLVFGAMSLPAIGWFVQHPDSYADTFGRWVIFKAHLRNPLDALQAFINPNTLGNRASLYWGFWDPSWLFFNSANAGAPLLLMAAPLIAAGLYRMTLIATETAALLIGTALIAPLAGATFGLPHYMGDAAVVLPVLALIGALGAEYLATLIRPRGRPLEDGVPERAVEGWDNYDASP
jgi:hypothetical protein